MNTADRISAVLKFVILRCINVILHPLWLTDVNAFQATLDATDCYPFRICYDLGEFKQWWIEDPRDIAAAMDRMDAWEEAHA